MTDPPATKPPDEDAIPESKPPEPQFIGWSAIIKGSALLLGVVAVAAIMTGYFMYQKYRHPAVVATICAAGICGFSGVAALVVTGIGTGKANGLAYTLGSIMIRSGIPVASLLAVSNAQPHLIKAGFFVIIIVLYPLTLAVETLVSVRLLKKQT